MSKVERTLILVKPDGVKRGKIGSVIHRVELKGYTIVDVKMEMVSKELLDKHYCDLVDKPFYPNMVKYMQSGPVVAIVAEGQNVIKGFRSLAGATRPTEAAPGTIRGDYGRDWDDSEVQNFVHGSDSPEHAEAEIALWFPNLTD
jgi:nucleoside-diphosphate kinase